MNANSPHSDPSAMRAGRPRFARVLVRLLGMFWINLLSLLGAVIYGLIAGWSTLDQWGEGLFFAAMIQIMFAGLVFVGSQRETEDSAYVRYVADGNVNDTRQQLVSDTLRKETSATRVFLGGMFTLLITFIMSLL